MVGRLGACFARCYSDAVLGCALAALVFAVGGPLVGRLRSGGFSEGGCEGFRVSVHACVALLWCESARWPEISAVPGGFIGRAVRGVVLMRLLVGSAEFGAVTFEDFSGVCSRDFQVAEDAVADVDGGAEGFSAVVVLSVGEVFGELVSGPGDGQSPSLKGGSLVCVARYVFSSHAAVGCM